MINVHFTLSTTSYQPLIVRMHHLGLYSQCGICIDTIFKYERVIALFGNDDSTSYRGQTRPFLFPDIAPNITRVDGFTLCRYPNCRTCAASPQFIPILTLRLLSYISRML
ncbi:hypothetical protein F4811DRAFT_482192 [Daldinia bambusicola]|nr:hypothetical protein F4811DRAFT_482192 [Daldinia bambusicola]